MCQKPGLFLPQAGYCSPQRHLKFRYRALAREVALETICAGFIGQSRVPGTLHHEQKTVVTPLS